MSRQVMAELRIPLDIANVWIHATKIMRDKQLYIRLESELERVTCGLCGQTIKCNYGLGKEIKLRHLDVLGMKTIIGIRPKRGQCPTCPDGPTTTQVLEWYQPRAPHTKAYDHYLLKQLVGSTIEDVSLKEEVGYDALLGVLKRHVATSVDWSQLNDLKTIGIDEIAMKKGHKDYAAIITARQADGQLKILGVLADRKKKAFAPS